MALTTNIKNRRASFEYLFLDTYTAGIVLTGTEIKSVRLNKVNIAEGYCTFKGDELWLKSTHIAEYAQGTYNNHLPTRERKLLLQKQELRKLQNKLKDKGLTIIPLRMYINERGFAKLDIALAKGKKLYDKRQDIKSKDVARQLRRSE